MAEDHKWYKFIMVKYEQWLKFIIDNFQPGKVKDISEHILKLAREKGLGKNYTDISIKAKVRQILPEWTPGKSDKRKKGKLFININGIYYLYEDHSIQTTLTLNSAKQVNLSENTLGEKISIETPKDKSIKHNDLLKLIKDYADEHNIESEPEKEFIDLLAKKDDKWIINEVKTYENSIFVAVGQVQFYRWNLKDKYKLENPDFILNIIGDFELKPKFIGFLKDININYINASNQENIKEIFNIENKEFT